MHKSKLLDLFHTFSARDFRRFASFVQSPYFNKESALIPLLNYLRQLAPAFPPKKLQHQYVWQQLYPESSFDEKQFAYYMSALLKLGEQFLGQEQATNRFQLQEIHILDGLEARSLDKHYKQRFKRTVGSLESDPFQTEEKHQRRFELASVAARFQFRKQTRTYDQGLQETVRHLDAFYLCARLRLTCELVNRQSILSATFDKQQVDALNTFLQGHPALSEPSVVIYHLVLKLLTGESQDADFQKLKTLLGQHLQVFPEAERGILVSYAQNYCIRRIRRGDTEYLQELFALYNQGLESGDLLDNGVLSPGKYKNIASVGLRVEAYDWVENFITQYLPLLPEEFRETGFAYNMAFLSYQRGELAQALKYLLQVEFNDVFFSLDTRKMMLMIYFEQGAEEAMVSLIASFRTYLRRNKLISDNNRLAYSNFIHLLNLIYKGGEEKEKLLKTIAATHPLVEELWLRQMAESGFLLS